MTDRRLRLAVAGIGIAVLIAAGIGIYFSGARTGPAGRLFTLHEVPRPLPVIRFRDGAGRALTLADFKGKVILLNIWATWCTPCREEMPALDRLQAKLGSADFEVVALSIDSEGPAAVRRFFSEVGVHALKLYVDPSGEAGGRLALVGVPTTLLVDLSGREIGRRLGPAVWDGSDAVEFIRARLGGQ